MTDLELLGRGHNFVAIKKIEEILPSKPSIKGIKWNEKDCLFWPRATV